VEGTPEGDERATKERAVGHGVPRGDVDLIPQSGAGMRVSPTGVGVLGTGGYHQERSDLLSAPLTEEMRGSPRQDPPPMGGLRLSPGAGGGIPGQVDFAVGGPDRAGVAVYGAPGPSREVREEPATRTEISALRSELTVPESHRPVFFFLAAQEIADFLRVSVAGFAEGGMEWVRGRLPLRRTWVR